MIEEKEIQIVRKEVKGVSAAAEAFTITSNKDMVKGTDMLSEVKRVKKLVEDAFSVNKFVPAILAGISPPVISRDGYVTMGGADEATEYVRECGAAWKETPGAIDWLAIVTAGSTTSRSVH